jgi:hypothetical protein
MENIMEVNKIEGIILTVNLRGALNGPVKHTDVVEVSTRVGANLLSRKITFTERGHSECVRKTVISESVIAAWMSGNCPEWAKPFDWKQMSKSKRLSSWISRFDEGYGVSFETL